MDSNTIKMPEHRTLIKWAFTFLAVVVVGVVFFGGYGGLTKLLSMLPGTESATASEVSGVLLLSVGTVSTTTGASTGIVPVTILAENNGVARFPVDQIGGKPALTIQHVAANDASSAVFLGAPFEMISNSTARVPDSLTVYVADLQGLSSYDDIVKAFQAANPVAAPTSEDYFREAPVVSSDKIVLYSSLSKEVFTEAADTLGNLPAETWNIYRVSADGEKTRLTSGLRPKWIDPIRFAFLKNDGVYLYDLDTNQEQRVWDMRGTLTIANGFDVSDDGELFALTDPGNATVSIVRATHWAGNILSLVKTLEVVASNPVFSPDSQYLAMVAVRPNIDPDGVPIPRIEYYSLQSSAFLENVMTFDPTTIDSIYLTDWRY